MANEFIPIMDDEEEVVIPDGTEGLISDSDPKVPVEGEGDDNEGDDVDDNPYVSKVNSLFSEGLITITTEELDEVLGEYDEFGPEEQEKVLIASLRKAAQEKEESFAKAKEEGIKELLESLDSVTKKGVEFSLSNPEPEEMRDFYKGLIYESDIKSLNPENIEDAEKILKEYYKDLGYKQEDIEEKISDLKQLNKLNKEAILVKPKLDAKAETIANRKLDEQKAIVDYEESRKVDLMKKINVIAKEGNIDGIPVTRETMDFLVAALAGQEYQVPIKGKKVDLNLAEAMILHHKHSPKGDLKLLMKALILLHNPSEFDKFYVKRVQTKETNRFIKEHRISSSGKSGAFVEPTKKTYENIPILLSTIK